MICTACSKNEAVEVRALRMTLELEGGPKRTLRISGAMCNECVTEGTSMIEGLIEEAVGELGRQDGVTVEEIYERD